MKSNYKFEWNLNETELKNSMNLNMIIVFIHQVLMQIVYVLYYHQMGYQQWIKVMDIY